MRTAILVMLFTPAIAAAEPTPHTQDNALSLELTTVQPTTWTVELDHDLGRRKLSVAAAAGVRAAALGDYSTWTYGAGVELRRWRRHPMRGWYAGAGLALAATRMTNEMDDRPLGTTWTGSATLSLGYRFIWLHTIELTPSAGAALVVERGEMSPPTARAAGLIGLTAGVIF
jgi:hypothetical protein